MPESYLRASQNIRLATSEADPEHRSGAQIALSAEQVGEVEQRPEGKHEGRHEQHRVPDGRPARPGGHRKRERDDQGGGERRVGEVDSDPPLVLEAEVAPGSP